jgi:SAM-dependent methyltransferase
MHESREILRDYYDAASEDYLDRASGGVMGWMRNRELAVTLDMIPKSGCGTALDAGCGPGYYSQVLRDRGFGVCAVDISPEMVTIVRGLGIPACVMDIEHSEPPAELPLPADFLFCAGVAEFAIDPVKFLSSLRQMLKPGGEMLIVAPLAGAFAFFYRRYLESKGIPCTAYTKKTMGTYLQDAGFEPLEARSTWPICLAVRAKAI